MNHEDGQFDARNYELAPDILEIAVVDPDMGRAYKDDCESLVRHLLRDIPTRPTGITTPDVLRAMGGLKINTIFVCSRIRT